MSQIRFGKCDVVAQEIPESDCDECGMPIGGRGWFVELDFRGAGETVQLGANLYCSETCAEIVAESIRKTLPECEDEDALPTAGGERP